VLLLPGEADTPLHLRGAVLSSRFEGYAQAAAVHGSGKSLLGMRVTDVRAAVRQLAAQTKRRPGWVALHGPGNRFDRPVG
jgi:hypothetical protein